MSYFDPRLYNEDNLIEADKREITFWRQTMKNAIYEALSDHKPLSKKEKKDPLKQLKYSIMKKTAKRIEHRFEDRIRDLVVGMIDDYPDEQLKDVLDRIEEEDKKGVIFGSINGMPEKPGTPE